ncbi:MAG: site-specific integrase [Propionibacteriaceae bacterium]|nr:site-specific integrase [Propionibacteriaceae bacterium]
MPQPNDLLTVWARYVVELRRGLVAEKTTATEVYHVQHGLPAMLGSMPLEDITALHITDAMAAMLRADRSRRTVQRSLVVLRTILERAILEGALTDSPTHGLRVPRGLGRPPRTARPLDIHQLRRVHQLQLRHSPLADVTLFLGLTGLRWSELRELRWGDITDDPDHPHMWISRAMPDAATSPRTTKSGEPRFVPLVPEARALLGDPGHPDELVWMSVNGHRLYGPNFRRSVHWTETMPGQRIHDLRHSFAVMSIAAGLDIKSVQAWLGHSDIRLTTDLYGRFRTLDADMAAQDRLTHALSATHP